MNDERPIREQRQTVRCTVTDTRQRCELKVGSRVLPARLLDESAGGFSVLVDTLSASDIAQTAELHTDAGWFDVRVAYMAELNATEDDATVADDRKRRFRLGLVRLGETVLPDRFTFSLLAGSLRFNMRQWHLPSGIPLIFGVLLAIIATAVPMTMIGLHWHFESSTVKRRSPPNDRVTKPIDFIKLPSRAARPPADASPVQSDGAKAASAFGQEPRSALIYLPGAAALAFPEIVQQLQLTADQQEQIGKLIAATSQSMRDLDKLALGRHRQEMTKLRTQLLDEARRKALELLTSQQREQWDKFSGVQGSASQ